MPAELWGGDTILGRLFWFPTHPHHLLGILNNIQIPTPDADFKKMGCACLSYNNMPKPTSMQELLLVV